jgi:hypothetical protein
MAFDLTSLRAAIAGSPDFETVAGKTLHRPEIQ